MKRLLLLFFAPFAKLSQALEPFRRTWAQAKLAARIQGEVHPSVILQNAPEIHGTGRITLGRELYLYRDLYLETQEGGSISIGNRVVISRGVHIVSFAGITIGENSMIGEYTSLRDANHRYGGGTPVRDSGHDASPIHIGRNVWIARGVTILPGVRIGDNSVVGANAVVTRDVPADTVVAGVPAKPLPARVAQ